MFSTCKLPKIPAKPSYSIVGNLHGMQGAEVRVRLATLESLLLITKSFEGNTNMYSRLKYLLICAFWDRIREGALFTKRLMHDNFLINLFL